MLISDIEKELAGLWTTKPDSSLSSFARAKARTYRLNRQRVLNAELASAIKSLRDSPEKFITAKKYAGPPPDSLAAEREGRAANAHLPREASNAIMAAYERAALQAARVSDRAWLDALRRYNSRAAYDVRYSTMFERLNAYFRQGQASPGRLTQPVVLAAIRQWDIDRAPGLFDKLAQGVQIAIVAYAAWGIGSQLLASTPTAPSTAGATSLTTTPTVAPVVSAPVTASALPSAAAASVIPTAGGIGSTVATVVGEVTATTGALAAAVNAISPKKTAPISAPQASAAPAQDTKKPFVIPGPVAVLGVAAVIALPFI